MLRQKVKLRKQLLVVRDIIMILTAVFFIIIAFLYALDKENSIGDSMRNIRYGLFSFALIISATAILIAVYVNKRQEIINLFNPKIKAPVKQKKLKDAIERDVRRKMRKKDKDKVKDENEDW